MEISKNVLSKIEGWIEDCSDFEDDFNINQFKKGGRLVKKNKKNKIHIKKSNEGKFTASAERAGMGVQEYARKVMSDPNASPKLKKRANFAIQASKWKH